MLTRKMVSLVAMVVRFVWRRPLLVLSLVLLALLLRHCLGTSPDTHIRPFGCPASMPNCDTDPAHTGGPSLVPSAVSGT